MYRKVEYNIVCNCCGKSFVAHDKRKIYCSHKCRDVAYKRSKGQDSRLKPRKEKCIICGKEFETFNAAQKTCSPECSKENKRRRDNRRHHHTAEEYKQILKKQVQQRAEVKIIEKRWYEAIHSIERECKVCGSLFYCVDTESRVTCSHECSISYAKSKKKYYKEKRLNQDNLIDKDISLETLFERDKGICYLCGELCDWSDHEWKNGNHYTGNNYPSIEHVVPLALGGKHQWENVRLAHFKCNVAKGVTTSTYTKEMAIEDARRYAREINTNKKKTAQYTIDGNLIKIWASTAQIKRELGLNDKHIQNVCRKAKTGNAYGFHWEYVV